MRIGNGQVEIYKLARSWRITFAIVIPLLMVLFGGFTMVAFLEGRSNPGGLVMFCFLFGIGFLLLLLYVLLSVFKAGIELHPDRIREVGLFRSTEIRINDIRGFRLLAAQYPPTLMLLQSNQKIKQIKTALMVEHRVELFRWLNRNFTNLDAVDFQEEMEEVLHDTRLGESKEKRQCLLDSAIKWSRILNGLGLAVIFWAIFAPQPYNFVIWMLVMSPLVALSFVRYFHGALKLDGDKEGGGLPNIAMAFLLPCFGLTLRAFMDFNILNWNGFWLPFIFYSISLFLLILLIARDIRSRMGTAILLFLFCALYGYSTVISLNCILDGSTPSLYQAEIMEKRVYRGKITSYYLRPSPWGPGQVDREIYVSKSVYDRSSVGEVVDVVVRNGRLGITWYDID